MLQKTIADALLESLGETLAKPLIEQAAQAATAALLDKLSGGAAETPAGASKGPKKRGRPPGSKNKAKAENGASGRAQQAPPEVTSPIAELEAVPGLDEDGDSESLL